MPIVGLVVGFVLLALASYFAVVGLFVHNAGAVPPELRRKAITHAVVYWVIFAGGGLIGWLTR